MSENHKYQTQIAIAILNWNGKSFLERFLQILIDKTDREISEIYIIDNNSSDNSLKYLNTNFPSVKTIVLDKNYGFAGGYNKGLENIDAKYYFLLNSDIEVTDNFLEPLYELMENNLDIGICGPKLNSFDQKNHFEYAGASGGYIDKFGYPFCRGRIFEKTEEDLGQYNDQNDCFWISGAALMIRSEIFEITGGFDDDFFAHQEEIDLCWRVQNLGHRITCEPKSYIYHIGGGTLPKSSPFKTYLNFRNSLFLIQKNLPKYTRQKVFFARFYLDNIAAIRMLFQGNLSDFLAVHKAYFHYLGKRKKMKNKRLQIKPNSPTNLKGFYNSSIVFDFYLKGKKSFKDIILNSH